MLTALLENGLSSIHQCLGLCTTLAGLILRLEVNPGSSMSQNSVGEKGESRADMAVFIVWRHSRRLQHQW